LDRGRMPWDSRPVKTEGVWHGSHLRSSIPFPKVGGGSMRKALSAGMALFTAFLAAGFAGAAEPKAVIDAPITASGGAEKLAKFNSETWKEKGTYYGMGAGQPYTGTYAVSFPDRFRMEIEGAFVIVLNGDKGWFKAGDNTSEMGKEQLEEQKENLYA